jgi:hypothetical protein
MPRSEHRTLKSVHLAGTIWFILCVGFILVLALRQAGVNWWIIFSLSGPSALIILLLVSLYLFAVFRGAGASQKIELEHPLTSTDYYMMFYVVAPFLGALAGCLGMMGVSRIAQFLLGVALGTLGTTFLAWVVVDPAVGLLETLLPASRSHRRKRLAEARALREQQQRDRDRLLEDVLASEEAARRSWQEMLKPQAEKLAALLTASETDLSRAEREAVDLGVRAWQIGGLGCMRQLRRMAMEICKERHRGAAIVDYVSAWWDGIGNWRTPSLQEMVNLQW